MTVSSGNTPSGCGTGTGIVSHSADSVTRTAYYKYLHPKEALISNGVLNR